MSGNRKKQWYFIVSKIGEETYYF